MKISICKMVRLDMGGSMRIKNKYLANFTNCCISNKFGTCPGYKLNPYTSNVLT